MHTFDYGAALGIHLPFIISDNCELYLTTFELVYILYMVRYFDFRSAETL
jgi:hypothetical protein